jgi:hypothetical protein
VFDGNSRARSFWGSGLKGTGPDGQVRPDIESGRFDESLTMASPMSMPDRIKGFSAIAALLGIRTILASPQFIQVREARSLRTEGTQAR